MSQHEKDYVGINGMVAAFDLLNQAANYVWQQQSGFVLVLKILIILGSLAATVMYVAENIDQSVGFLVAAGVVNGLAFYVVGSICAGLLYWLWSNKIRG